MNERLTAFVGAKINEFRKKMAEVNKTVRKTATKVTAPIGANTKEFKRKVMGVKKDLAMISKKTVVEIDVRVNKFQKRMDNLANTIRTFNTVGANMGGGMLLMASPSLVPIVAATVGLLGALGPMIGTIGGSTFALGSAFGFAGTAALAFGAAAIPTISKLFDETAKLTSAQQKAKDEYDKFKSTWQDIVKDLEKPVLEAFGKSMQFATKVLEMARPLFDGAAIAVNNLLDSLNQSLNSAPVKAFFDYMNKQGGPLLETLGKASGNFIQGFMSMMTAFGPLAEKTAQGFLNMSQGFADWSAGLSKSDKFQSFVKYIEENMPKIRAIFRDALAGIAYFFSAFGPLSSDMMTGLQNMMARFKEWASTLKDNPAFQNFIGYIRDNAPKVVELIGNLTNFIVNMGIALAPLGAKILEIVNGFLSWTNNMMEAHPWIGKIFAVLLIITGALIALAPSIIAVATLFKGLGVGIAGAIGKILKVFLPFKGSLLMGLKMLGKSVLTFAGRVAMMAIRVAASWLVAMGPVGWVIAVVLALVALIIANWDTVKKWTVKIWTAVWTWIKDTWNKIKTGTTTAAREVWQAVKKKFTDIVNSVRDKMNDTRDKVKEGWNKAKSFLEGINLYQIGKDIIQGLINGIGSMATSLVNKAKGVVNGAIEGAKSLLGIASPSKVFKKFGVFTGQGMAIGMDKTKSLIQKASDKMAKAAMIEPQRTQFAFDASMNKSDFGKIRKDFSAEVSDFEMPDPTINVYNEWDGEKVVSYVERSNVRKSRILDGFSGRK